MRVTLPARCHRTGKAFLLLLSWPTLLLAQDSPHGPLAIPCTDCHTTQNWHEVAVPATFDHDTTSFPLTGAHRSTTCVSCHRNLRFQGTQSECISCHKRDYDGALTVNHRQAGFGTDCTLCHDLHATSWLASFDHDKTDFPTRGIHESLPCGACHANNRFRGTPVECVACHRSQYLAATNPNHQQAGFSLECATCHRALTWQPAAFFPHDGYFPISDGATHHPGVWNTCADCHLAQPNYTTFECIDCHEHSKDRTDARHAGRSGYEYKSTACYRCHSRP
ncbi:MAG: hypothetical protein WB699_07830 [Bacteroidota bacterium]